MYGRNRLSVLLGNLNTNMSVKVEVLSHLDPSATGSFLFHLLLGYEELNKEKKLNWSLTFFYLFLIC